MPSNPEDAQVDRYQRPKASVLSDYEWLIIIPMYIATYICRKDEAIRHLQIQAINWNLPNAGIFHAACYKAVATVVVSLSRLSP